MHRVDDSLEFHETYDGITRLMDRSLIAIEKNCQLLRDHMRKQRESLADSIRMIVDDAKKIEALQATINFYDHIRSELIQLEEIFHEYRDKIQADFTSEINQRLLPPYQTSFEAVKKAYDLCQPSTSILHLRDNNQRVKDRLCNWTNISPNLLKHTQDIIYGPKKSMPSEFDDTDQKFKQEMISLRTKMFSISQGRKRNSRNKESITDERRLSIGNSTKKEFIETVKKMDPYSPPLLEREFAKVVSLKFVDGEFQGSDIWMRLLDSYGQQLRSKWYLIICPQIELILKRQRVTTIRLSARKSFDFIMKIPENGFSFKLSRKDIISLVERISELSWLENWKKQLRSIDGKEVAATLIQSYWRGFWIRKSMFEAKCKYIAASIIWVAWIVVKKKRQMHERYLGNMLVSLDLTRQLNAKFANEYSTMIRNYHIVIHLPSVGFPLEIRRTFGTEKFAIYQNTMSLKLSFVKNPHAQVICVLPVKLTDDLLTMYDDLIESVVPNENAQKRITFLELSQLSTFANCSFNVARTLHASEDTLVEIRKLIQGKPTFCLPWIMDECDVDIAGNFGIPLLAPDMETQRRILDKSYMSEMMDEFYLQQPYCVTNIKDYATLCEKLAEQICLNTDICVWLFKLNIGMADKHTGRFLINHMSVPFMPILRKERAIHGNEWKFHSDIRSNFLNCLKDYLPKIVTTVTRFSEYYEKWEDFYGHMTKYGCLLQAVPNIKLSNNVTVTLFIPGHETGQSPQWTGTAEKISLLATESRFATFVYTIPQTFVDNSHLEPVIERLSNALRKNGYFGHLSIDLCCFNRKRDDKFISLVIEIIPFYDHTQHFVDWMKFAINGSYDRTSKTFDADVSLLKDIRLQRSSMNVPYARGTKNWNETTGRFGVAIGQLFHSKFSSYSWKEIRDICEDCGIRWNSSTKEGSHLILHDGTSKDSAMLIAITSNMQTTLVLMKNSLKKLYKSLNNQKVINSNNNFLEAISTIEETLRNHKNLSIDKCDPLNRVR